MQRIQTNSQLSEIESEAYFIDNASDILSIAEVVQNVLEPEKQPVLPVQHNSRQTSDVLAQVLEKIEKCQPDSQEKNKNDPNDGKNSSMIKDPLQYLFSLKDSIGSKMIELSSLNEEFYEKQEKMFLKTFVNMMDRMSSELLETKQKLKNIDQQIEAMPECVKMRQKMEFYRDECVLLRGKMRVEERQTDQIRMRCDIKARKLADLQKQLYRKKSRSTSYKKRKYSLQTKLYSEIDSKHFKSFLTEQEMVNFQKTPPPKPILKNKNETVTIQTIKPKTQDSFSCHKHFVSHDDQMEYKTFQLSSRERSNENSFKRMKLHREQKKMNRSQFILGKYQHHTSITGQTHNDESLNDKGLVMAISSKNYSHRGYLIKQRLNRKQVQQK